MIYAAISMTFLHEIWRIKKKVKRLFCQKIEQNWFRFFFLFKTTEFIWKVLLQEVFFIIESKKTVKVEREDATFKAATSTVQ
jgi:hypothetical protein